MKIAKSYNLKVSFDHLAKDEESEKWIDYIVKRFQEHKVCIFFGAGVSHDFPTLNPLVADNGNIPGLRKILTYILLQGSPKWAEDAIKSSVENKPLEWLLEHFVAVVGNQALEILNLLEAGNGGLASSPNYNHFALALLAQAGFCRFFLTVNFDTLFEQAFIEIKKNHIKEPELKLVVPEESRKEKQEKNIYFQVLKSPPVANCYLFKLHGTLKNPLGLLTTVETLGFGLPEHKRRLIQTLLRGSTCLFAGYRHGDLDIFPMLDMLPSDVGVIWYEKDETVVKSPAALGRFLTRRPHFLIIGDLAPTLKRILDELSVSDATIRQMLQMGSFSDSQQSRAEDEKAKALWEFAHKFASEHIPNDAARLIAARILYLDYPKGLQLREKLIDSIDPEKLRTDLRYSYYAELAERRWNVGNLSVAIKFRKLALHHIRESLLSSNDKKRSMIEQRFRMTRDSLNLLKHSRGFKALFVFGFAAIYMIFFVALLLMYRNRLTRGQRGTFYLNLCYLPGDFFEWVHEVLIRKKLRLLVESGQKATRKRALLSMLSKRAIACAGFFYGQYKRYSEFSFGWNSHCMRRLGETLLHQTQSDVPEVHRLFAEADRPIGWVENNPEKLQGELDQAVKPGLHVALLLLYAGSPDEAFHLLQEQYKVYERTEHLSGKRKTLLYQALCLERMGRKEEISQKLKELENLIASYR